MLLLLRRRRRRGWRRRGVARGLAAVAGGHVLLLLLLLPPGRGHRSDGYRGRGQQCIGGHIPCQGSVGSDDGAGQCAGEAIEGRGGDGKAEAGRIDAAKLQRAGRRGRASEEGGGVPRLPACQTRGL